MAIKKENDDIITTLVRFTLPENRVNKNLQQLLSGDYHLQIIGNPAKAITVSCLADATGRDYLNNAEAIGEKIIVESQDGDLTGIIETGISWAAVSHGLYEAIFKVVEMP